MVRVYSSLLLSLLITSSASAVTMDWTPIGNPGNACDPQPFGCFGSVPYTYSIGTYEVTNAQYAEFLNAKAASDPFSLYSPAMSIPAYGGITRSGSSGSYTYSAIAGREDMPVNWVSFIDALRFANWMNNGQGTGDTESGAYTLVGGADPTNRMTVTRNAGATIVLPTDNEWHKAAYHNAVGLSATDYFDYPAGSDAQTTCSYPPVAAPNSANCFTGDNHYQTEAGSYVGSASPYGTFDQGGNVFEWNEAIVIISGQSYRGLRGGSFAHSATISAASTQAGDNPLSGSEIHGFRLVLVPEPGTGLLVIAGLFGLAGWRRVRD